MNTFTITYSVHADDKYPCFAKTEIDGNDIRACGETWDDAKQKLLSNVTLFLETKKLAVPEPETITIQKNENSFNTLCW